MKQPEKKAVPEASADDRDELRAALGFFKEYGRSILIGVLGALVLVVAVTSWRTRGEVRESEAAAQLSAARAPEQLAALLDRYPRTTAAPLAALRLGSQLARAGQWGEALQVYEGFGREHPGHPFAPSAEVNAALCLEALGRIEEAIAAYETWERAHPGHYLQPLAWLGRARCEALAGRTEKARERIEDFLVAHPDSPWNDLAETALRSLRGPLPARPEESLDASPDVLQDA